MPQIEPWNERLDELLEMNEGTDLPSSVRSLAAALAGMPGATQNMSSWLTTLKRIRRTGRCTERNAVLIAAALGVRRRQLPAAADRMTAAVLDSRLEAVEAWLDRLADQFDPYADLYERVVALEQAARTGNAREDPAQ